MDRVPLEVFTKITSYLKYTEKLELLRVSRYWRGCIQFTNLYNDISTKGKTRFEKAMKLFNNEELYARQVHCLQLTKPEADFLTILKVPSLFPHLEEFVWEDYSNENVDEENIPEDLEKQLEQWKKLRSITETNRYLYMPLFLRSGTFPMLTKLKINLHFAHADIGNDMISHLDNAPLLTHLDITHISLTLRQIEMLHEKTPHLEVLCLNDVTQLMDEFDTVYTSEMLLSESARQVMIQPATKLHTLWFERVSFLGVTYGVERHWLKYISQKYTNMINFTISGVGMGSNPQPYYETGLTWIAEKCHKMKNYKVKIFPLTPTILAAMDTSGIQLKTVEVMSDGTAQEQLIDLSNSQQKEFIESISVKSFNGGNAVFRALRGFPRLKELDISSTANITLNSSLKQLPQLEYLSLSSGDVSIDASDNEVIPLKLKSLVMERVMFNTSEDIFSFVAASAPHLSTLCVQGQVSDTKIGPLKVHFPSHYFGSIKVYILGNLYYQVSNDRTVTWYNSRGKRYEDRLQNESNGFQDGFHVSISCKGFSTFTIGSSVIPNW